MSSRSLLLTLALVAALLPAPAAPFGSVAKKKPEPAPADEWACRAVKVNFAVNLEAQLQDCLETGLFSAAICEAEVANLKAHDTIGCGEAPLSLGTEESGPQGEAPSLLCDCCQNEIEGSGHKETLCKNEYISAACNATCGGGGDDTMLTVVIKLALTSYINDLNVDSNATAPQKM